MFCNRGRAQTPTPQPPFLIPSSSLPQSNVHPTQGDAFDKPRTKLKDFHGIACKPGVEPDTVSRGRGYSARACRSDITTS